MSQIIAAQIACDENGLFVLDTMGRVWARRFSEDEIKWIWSRVELPEDTQ